MGRGPLEHWSARDYGIAYTEGSRDFLSAGELFRLSRTRGTYSSHTMVCNNLLELRAKQPTWETRRSSGPPTAILTVKFPLRILKHHVYNFHH